MRLPIVLCCDEDAYHLLLYTFMHSIFHNVLILKRALVCIVFSHSMSLAEKWQEKQNAAATCPAHSQDVSEGVKRAIEEEHTSPTKKQHVLPHDAPLERLMNAPTAASEEKPADAVTVKMEIVDLPWPDTSIVAPLTAEGAPNGPPPPSLHPLQLPLSGDAEGEAGKMLVQQAMDPTTEALGGMPSLPAPQASNGGQTQAGTVKGKELEELEKYMIEEAKSHTEKEKALEKQRKRQERREQKRRWYAHTPRYRAAAWVKGLTENIQECENEVSRLKSQTKMTENIAKGYAATWAAYAEKFKKT